MTTKHLLTILLSVVLISCGGGGSSSDSGGTTGTFATGVFLDSPVEGLSYETSSGLSGTTDSDGTFSYKTGDSVTFKLHNITLGSGSASGVMFPKDMVSSLLNADLTDAEREQSLKQAHKIAQLLQSLDDDGNADNGINITGLTTTQVNSLTATADAITTILEDHTKDLNASDLTGIIPTASGGTFTSFTDAKDHVEKTFTNQKEYSFKGIVIDSSTSSEATDYISVKGYPAKVGNDNITSIASKVRINNVSLSTTSGEQKARSGLKLRLSGNNGDYLYFFIRATAYHNFNDSGSDAKNKVTLSGYAEHTRYDSVNKKWIWTKAKSLNFNNSNYINTNKPFDMKLAFYNNNEVAFIIDDESQTYAITDVVSDVMSNDSSLSLNASDFTKVSEVAVRNRIKNASSSSSINSTFSKIKINDKLIDNSTGYSTVWNGGNLANFSADNHNASYTFTTASVLDNAGNKNPEGIWTNGTTMWIADSQDAKIYAYKMSDKSRDASKDFDTLSSAGNNDPVGIWSDGTTMWVVDSEQNNVYAYNMTTKANEVSSGFNTTSDNSEDPAYITSDGTTFWITGCTYSYECRGRDKKVYAYTVADQTRDAFRDINSVLDTSINNTELGFAPIGLWYNSSNNYVSVVDASDYGRHQVKTYEHKVNGAVAKLLGPASVITLENEFNSRGIFSDGTTLWVSNHAGNQSGIGARVLAYNLSTGERDASKDF
jgi:hypothetical protein